jgi:hypothetical protein
VPRLGRADEIILRHVESGHHVAKHLRVAVGQGLGGEPFGRRRLLHLEAMLVGAGEKEYVLAVEPLEARDDVGRQRRVGVADVGGAVGIEDRRGNVEFLLPAHGRRFRVCC